MSNQYSPYLLVLFKIQDYRCIYTDVYFQYSLVFFKSLCWYIQRYFHLGSPKDFPQARTWRWGLLTDAADLDIYTLSNFPQHQHKNSHWGKHTGEKIESHRALEWLYAYDSYLVMCVAIESLSVQLLRRLTLLLFSVDINQRLFAQLFMHNLTCQYNKTQSFI